MTERLESSDACRDLVRKALTNFRLPYITITPTFSICPHHGYLKGEWDFCPRCDEEMGVTESPHDPVVRTKHTSERAHI